MQERQDLELRIRELERDSELHTERGKALLESQARYERLINTIPCALYDYVRWPDGRSSFIYISPQCESIFEHDAASIVQNPDLLWSMVHAEDLERLQREDLMANRTGITLSSEVRIVLSGGRIKWIQLTSSPSDTQIDGAAVWSGVVLDISERKRLEEERNRLFSGLENAVAEISALQGIIPICSYCKNIRDDSGYWEQVEVYMQRRSQAEFSHGICPECAQKHFPEMGIYDKT